MKDGKENFNLWKVYSIILLIAIIAICFHQIYFSPKNTDGDKVNIGEGIKLNPEDVNSLKEIFPEDAFQVCDMDSGRCVVASFKKGKLDN